MQTFKITSLAAFIAVALSGCMANDLERAGIGAAAGAGTALIVDGSVGTGILIGGLAGAVCDDVNLC